jgi:hypothetical protein
VLSIAGSIAVFEYVSPVLVGFELSGDLFEEEQAGDKMASVEKVMKPEMKKI